MRRFVLTVLLTLSPALAAEREITLKVKGATLAATLQTPDGISKPPVVILWPGSGPTDRNGDNPAAPSGNLRKLAAALAQEGLASLRVDKRGIGQSVALDPREEALRFDDYVADARAWADWLSTQPELGQVVFAGHSEGGLVGLALLAWPQPPKVGALLLLATPGEPLGDTLRRQLRQNRANPPALIEASDRILSQLEAGQPATDVPPPLLPLYRPSVQPYLMSLLSIKPTALIAKVKVPTLIVQGERDWQVSLNDAQRLKEAQRAASLVVFPQMNHVLVDAPADQAGNFATYSQAARPLTAGLARRMATFVRTALQK